MAVPLYKLRVAADKLEPGRYTGEQLMQHFRQFYGEDFTSHDLGWALEMLQWRKVSRGSGRGFYVNVKPTTDKQ